MASCGYIKVQPDGLKEKAAKSTQKWDPVSKRMVAIPPRNVISNLVITRSGETSTVFVTWKKTSPIRPATLQFYRTDTLTNITHTLGGPIYIYDTMQSYTTEIDFQYDSQYFCTLTEPCSDVITSNKIITVSSESIVTIVDDLPYSYFDFGIYTNVVDADYDVTITWTCVPPSQVMVELFVDGSVSNSVTTTGTSYTFNTNVFSESYVHKDVYANITPTVGPSVQTRTVSFIAVFV